MKLSLVALVVVFVAATHAVDRSELDAWDTALQRLRALKEKRGWLWGGGDDKKQYCDTPTDKALTKAYNKECGTKFDTYTLGIKSASAFIQGKCTTLNSECCKREEGCETDEIKECCPKGKDAEEKKED